MCWLSYTSQAKAIAIFEIITSVFSLLSLSITTLVISLSPSLREYIYHQSPYNIFNIFIHFPTSEKVPLLLLPTFYFVGELCLAVWLYKSVEEKNYKRCRIWYIITLTVCLTGLYFFIPGIIFTDDNYYFLLIFVASYLFTAYSVWVVFMLMGEMRAEGLHRPIPLWDDETDKF